MKIRKTIVVCLMCIAATALPTRLIAGEGTGKSGPGEVRSDRPQFPLGPMLLTSYALVTVAFGAGFGWQAYQENEDFNKKVNGEYPLATQSLADDIKVHSITADVLMFGGAAAAIGGILWWVLDDDFHKEKRKQAPQAALKWRPAVGPNHASVVLEF